MRNKAQHRNNQVLYGESFSYRDSTVQIFKTLHGFCCVTSPELAGSHQTEFLLYHHHIGRHIHWAEELNICIATQLVHSSPSGFSKILTGPVLLEVSVVVLDGNAHFTHISVTQVFLSSPHTVIKLRHPWPKHIRGVTKTETILTIY